MATTPLPAPVPLFASVPRNTPMPRLSAEDADKLREHKYCTLPRTGTCPLYTVASFVQTLEAATLQVADLRAQYDAEGRSDWWHMADLLDDLFDLRTALHGQYDGETLQRTPVCMLEMLPTTVVPEYYKRTPRLTPEMEARRIAKQRVREYKLQNLSLCAGPSIVSASMFSERLMGAVMTVADLRERYLQDDRHDWWHMADLMDDLADLMDTLRPGLQGQPPHLAVRDVPYAKLWI